MQTGYSQQIQTTPWVSLSPAQQRASLSSLSPRDRRRFLEEETNRLLSDGHSEDFQSNNDFRAVHADGRSLSEDFDGDKNNSDDGEPQELVLDGSYIGVDGESDEAPEPHQDQEGTTGASLASSWVDCATEESRWGKNEWNAVRALSAPDMKNHDVLIGLARGMSVADIAKAIGRTPKQVRNIINKRLWKDVQTLAVADIARHLDDPDTIETVARRPPSRAGRKPKGWVAEIKTAEIIGIGFDLFGDPVQVRKARRRKVGVRRLRACPEIQGQLAFNFDLAA